MRNRKYQILLIITRIFSSLLAAFFAVAFIPKLIGEYTQAITGEKIWFGGWEGMIMELTFYLFLIGYLFSWWKKCTGSIIILLAAVVQMGPFLIIEQNLGSLIFGIPLLISGGLLLFLCRAQKKKPG